MKNKILSEIFAFLLILLFVYAAATKLVNFAVFRDQLNSSPLLKGNSLIIAVTLPVAELIVAIMLAIHATRKTGFIISACIMLLFTGYITYMLLFSGYLPCSCGGVLEVLSWKQHLVFNIFFLVIAFFGWRMNNDHKLAY